MTTANSGVTEEPRDRLTRLCAQMAQVLDTPENQDVQAGVFLSAGDTAGLVFHGYSDSIEGVAAVFMHLQAVFAANGKRMDFMSLQDEGVTRVDGPDGRDGEDLGRAPERDD